MSHYTWIYARPTRANQPIGHVRPGTSVPLASEERVAGSGCRRWLAVEPHGYVCHDATVTRDLRDPLFLALQEANRTQDEAYPYGYAYSLGAPMYGRIPSPEEQQTAERFLKPVAQLPDTPRPSAGHEELASRDVALTPAEPPPFASLDRDAPRMRGYDPGLIRKQAPEGALLSFSRAFESSGRTFLMTTDLTFVPADRVRLFRPSQFRGVHIGKGIELPFAWTRGAARTKYREDAEGKLVATDQAWPPRTAVPLTGASRRQGAHEYLETREPGLYLRDADASVIDGQGRPPFAAGPKEKWIEVSIGKGTLTLYEGTQAVFSTLASPGAGGAPPSARMTNEQLVKGSHTPTGVYRITYKTRATTMTPERVPNPKKYWIADVPHTLYFRQPFAIHAAYWHEDFGQPKSAGCVNLSPLDAAHVFGWADPQVPPEWSGASSHALHGLGTRLVIRR